MATIHIPTFTTLNPTEQCEQLIAYLKELNPSLTFTDNSIKEIVLACNHVFSAGKEQDAESVFNSVVTLIFELPTASDECKVVTKAFCLCLVEAPTDSFASIALRVTKNLYDGLFESIDLQYEAYVTLVKLATRTSQLSEVYKDLSSVKSKYNIKTVGVERTQHLYRLLYNSLLAAGKGDLASQVMIELLGTYTEENASQAKKDAVACIAYFLKDPNTFLIDHLLTLKPVKFLEGEPIHDLLIIFVSKKLQDYVTFYQKHKSLVDSLGLSHEQNIQKLRSTPCIQMAECKKGITHDTIQEVAQFLKLSLKNEINQVERATNKARQLDEIKNNQLLEDHHFLLDVKTKIKSGRYLLQLIQIKCEISAASEVVYRNIIETIRALDNKLNHGRGDQSTVKSNKELMNALPSLLKKAAIDVECVDEIKTISNSQSIIKSMLARNEKLDNACEQIVTKISKLSVKYTLPNIV